MKELNAAKGKYSLKDIKEKLKGHKVVKDVNKDGNVIIELGVNFLWVRP